MGTSGLVGIFGTIEGMKDSNGTVPTVAILLVILPIVLVYVVDLLFRKFNLIKKDDLKI